MKRRRKRSSTPLLLIAFFIGLIMVVYPGFSDYYNSLLQVRAIYDYAETVASLDTEKYRALWEAALDYNAELAEVGTHWELTDEEKEAYEAVLDVNGSGNMGYIDIPKISVSLPVYHGTEESVLQTSIGHIQGSSLPAGSRYQDDDVTTTPLNGSHCVVSGHRGLPSAKLFSELDKLVEGDTFILTILDQTLTYEVDQIRIVEPYDLSELNIEPEKDLCTLVTCTPYGVNTHRMLVRGHRVENERKTDLRIIADGIKIQPMFVAPFIAIPVLLLLVLWMFIMTSGWRRRKLNNSRAELRQEIRQNFGEELKDEPES